MLVQSFMLAVFLKALGTLIFGLGALYFLWMMMLGVRNREKVSEEFWRRQMSFGAVCMADLMGGANLVWVYWPLAAICTWPVLFRLMVPMGRETRPPK